MCIYVCVAHVSLLALSRACGLSFFLNSLGAVVYLTLLYGQLQDQGNKVAVNCLPLYSDQIDDR